MRVQFLAEAAGKPEGDIFFRQLITECRAPFVPAMAGIDNNEILHGARSGWRRHCLRRESWWNNSGR